MRDRLVMIALASAACGHNEPAPVGGAAIPRITAPIAIDGECDEADWQQRALIGELASAGEPARPSSEIRLLRDEHQIYVALYAADEDIRAGDAFDVTIGARSFHITAAGVVTPEGARFAIDRDGTLDDERDLDEEWVVELAVPYDVVGSIPIGASRCDTPKDGITRCGSWRAVVE